MQVHRDQAHDVGVDEGWCAGEQLVDDDAEGVDVGAAVAGVLAAFPRELVVAVAGLALLGTISGGLAGALRDENHRDAALLTFVVTLSGLTLAGIGSAFWGVVAGGVQG